MKKKLNLFCVLMLVLIAAQIIVDSSEYPVKFPIYEILKSRKDGE